MEFLLFYLFASLASLSSLLVILCKNPVQSVLYLVLAFANAAALLLLLEVEFLALLLLVVYVGAIAVLFLFVIMMLSPKTPTKTLELPGLNTPFLGLGVFVVSVFGFLFYQLEKLEFTNVANYSKLEGIPTYLSWLKVFDGVGFSNSNLESLGQVLYTYYFFYFLVGGFILLVAMIGAIVLTLEPRDLRLEAEQTRMVLKGEKGLLVASAQNMSSSKRQQVYEQLSRDSKNAVFLTK
jgi:NADH-quinone oxidoreductase subunit J